MLYLYGNNRSIFGFDSHCGYTFHLNVLIDGVLQIILMSNVYRTPGIITRSQ